MILDVNVKVSQKQTCRRTTEKKIKWFKLENIETRTKFKERALQELKQKIGVDDDVEQWWNQSNATMLRIGKEVLGESNGKIMENKETWWFNEEVQQKTKRKKEAKKRYKQTEDEIDKESYKQCKKEAKQAVAIAKAEAYEEIHKELDTKRGQRKIFRLAKQRQRSTRDITHIRQIQDENGNVLRKETKIVKRWQQYFENLLNEENERYTRGNGISNQGVVRDISRYEVVASLGKVKKGKAPGPDKLPIEAW